jgi:hypothetical protein
MSNSQEKNTKTWTERRKINVELNSAQDFGNIISTISAGHNECWARLY